VRAQEGEGEMRAEGAEGERDPLFREGGSRAGPSLPAVPLLFCVWWRRKDVEIQLRGRVLRLETATTNTKARKHENTKHSLDSSLAHRALPFESQLPFELTFEEVLVGRGRVDLIVGNEIVVELKAVDRLRDIHFAQLKSYLRATGLRVGLIFNFNAPTLAIRRMVLD
jgi:GxxExxY protein